MSNLKELQNDLENLQRAIRSGISSVTVGGQTTTFASMKDMREVAADIRGQIDECLGLDAKKPRVSTFNLTRGV